MSDDKKPLDPTAFPDQLRQLARMRRTQPAQQAAAPPMPDRGTAAWFKLKSAEHKRKREMRAVVEELERNGTTGRVLAAAQRLGSPFFGKALNLKIKRTENAEKLTILDPVRGMVMRLLAEEWGLDLEGVNVAVRWDPATRQLSCRAEPSPPALAEAARAVALRRREEQQKQP